MQAQKATGTKGDAKSSNGSQKASGRGSKSTAIPAGDSARSENEAVHASPHNRYRPGTSPHTHGRRSEGSNSLQARRERALWKTMHPNSPARSGRWSGGLSSRLAQSPAHSGRLSGRLGPSPAHSGQLEGQSHGRSSPLGEYDPQHGTCAQQDPPSTGAHSNPVVHS